MSIMDDNSSNWNDECKELDPELQAVDRLLREDGNRFFERERARERECACDREQLRAQFDRLIERLEREMQAGSKKHL
jgi:formyltetrahydrofolate hydrolase